MAQDLKLEAIEAALLAAAAKPSSSAKLLERVDRRFPGQADTVRYVY